MPDHRPSEPLTDCHRIVIVGFCAAGKSTLAAALRTLGFDAHVCSQEHSCVADLWRRSDPDVLIGIDVDLPTLRQRRGDAWPAPLYLAQRRRLASAFAAADLMLDSTASSKEAMIGRAHCWLARRFDEGSAVPNRSTPRV